MPNKIRTIEQLSEAITAGVNYAIKFGTDITSDGNGIIGYDEMGGFISKEDFARFFDLIVAEIEARPEILDVTADETVPEVSVVYALDYCASYEWMNGDESTFDCSREEWEQRPTKPVSQPLSLAQMAKAYKEATK